MNLPNTLRPAMSYMGLSPIVLGTNIMGNEDATYTVIALALKIAEDAAEVALDPTVEERFRLLCIGKVEAVKELCAELHNAIDAYQNKK